MMRTPIAAGTLVVVLVLAGCSTSPKEQSERLRKAAGVTAFRLTCTRDLWERTGGYRDRIHHDGDPVKAQITDQGNGMVLVQMTGPQLVDLLKKLDAVAHPERGFGPADPLAVRVYNAIAPKVDAISTAPAADAQIPQVIINDNIGHPTPTPSPSRPSGHR
ncbi:hypothetical protein ACFOY4_30830 [Actinomadura syzygii]|uniref:Lipoprotein n=1 Tax=Actinomadura syzygii TaxID=1427538 RepID=A0A5D0TSA6_9ACTN|nr:hypothetical protein [Actinomadura syzygii]TYC08717.1 hypothetical protein FXF65_38235 [Actinomadura syzygii]